MYSREKTTYVNSEDGQLSGVITEDQFGTVGYYVRKADNNPDAEIILANAKSENPKHYSELPDAERIMNDVQGALDDMPIWF